LTIARTQSSRRDAAEDAEPVAQYAVAYGPDAPDAESYRRPRPYQTFAAVAEARPVSPVSSASPNSPPRTPASPAPLWDLSRVEWRKVMRLQPSIRHRVRSTMNSGSSGSSGSSVLTVEQAQLFA
jgi:hypothetical protein